MKKSYKTLYQQVLGDSFKQLHPTLQHFHSAPKGGSGSGTFRITRGRGWWRSVLARAMGFPPTNETVFLQMQVRVEQDEEVWDRLFGAHRVSTRQKLQDGFLIEYTRSMHIGLKVSVQDQNLLLESTRVWLFGLLPLPRLLSPSVRAETRADAHGWVAHIQIRLWGIDPVISYQGYLTDLRY